MLDDNKKPLTEQIGKVTLYENIASNACQFLYQQQRHFERPDINNHLVIPSDSGMPGSYLELTILQ